MTALISKLIQFFKSKGKMKMHIQIKNRFTAEVLFECEAESMKAAVKLAVEKKADLRYADLRYADLRYADLSAADLRYADLRYADLRYADLRLIKEDFFKVLSAAKTEVVFLYDSLMRGKIDGSVYRGECACLIGTIAKAQSANYESFTGELSPNGGRPAEKWFLAIQKGDTPQTNQVSAITQGWIEEFSAENQITLPKYKLISDSEYPKAFIPKEKKPLAVGDRVRVYGYGNPDSWEWKYVGVISDVRGDVLKIKPCYDKDQLHSVHAHQCRRLKPKAIQPSGSCT